MKKLFTLFVLAFIVQFSFGQSTLPNGDFEDWIYIEQHGYWEPGGGFFSTLNILDTIPQPSGITVYPVTDLDSVHGGTKAARLITRSIDLLQVLIPGVIGTLKIQWANFNAALGVPYTWTTKAERFQGYYMSFPLNGDSTAAICLLSKWNTTTKQRDTIAYAKEIFHGEVYPYAEFDVPLEYYNVTIMPDSITLLLLSCGGYNASNMMGSVGQIGSQAYFDDVTLTNISGIEMILMPEVEVNIAPNPATGRITVTLDKQVKHSMFEVYNGQGQLMNQFPLEGKSNTLDVSHLSTGIYYYKVTDGTTGLNSGSFVIAR